MRNWILAAAATCTLAVSGALTSASAMPAGGFGELPNHVEQAQFVYGGRTYCWYNNGWRGPGFYWCGYAWRRGYGWGGGYGWRGWHSPRYHGGWHGRPPGRPHGWHGHPGRPPHVRPPHGGGRPHGGRPHGGGGHHGGGHHGGGGHHRR